MCLFCFELQAFAEETKVHFVAKVNSYEGEGGGGVRGSKQKGFLLKSPLVYTRP